MSTGDSRRPSSAKQSGAAAASDGPEPEVVDDAPKGGVLPVKKAVRRPGAAASGSSRNTESTGSTGTSAAKSTGSGANGAPANGNATARKATAGKASPAKAASAKAAPTKAAPVETTPAKATPASSSSAPAAKTTATKASPTKTSPTRAKVAGSKAPGARPGGRGPAGSGKGRKPMAPIRVAQTRNWGPIALYTATAVLALSIIGFGAWKVIERDNAPTWQEQAADISGVSNYKESNPEWFQYDPNFGNHQTGELTYPISPPVGGTHNPKWQSCMGDVYTSQISNEQAVHSMEHGAVWITYRPDLPQDQIDRLASKVRDVEYTLMSPLPGQDKAISLQAWGYQLKVDNAGDDRIDEFINALKRNATQEPGATCSGGITDATVKPLDLPGA